MRCLICQSEITPTDRFCAFCGASLLTTLKSREPQPSAGSGLEAEIADIIHAREPQPKPDTSAMASNEAFDAPQTYFNRPPELSQMAIPEFQFPAKVNRPNGVMSLLLMLMFFSAILLLLFSLFGHLDDSGWLSAIAFFH